jgi:hypothetical protein
MTIDGKQSTRGTKALGSMVSFLARTGLAALAKPLAAALVVAILLWLGFTTFAGLIPH